ncbi:MAG: hypothetical protein ACREV5_14050 [Steroidobacter sp.]
MMDHMFFVVLLVAALGSGLMGGLFFAFSAFTMTALARLPSLTGAAAMRSINRQANTPSAHRPNG